MVDDPEQMLGMPVAVFFDRYWQQKPLLLRSALTDYDDPITPDDLAGLACEPLAESRLIHGPDKAGNWQVEIGPFEEDRFARLEETGWTLLVQDVDKLLAEVDVLLEKFRFIPDWRLDDIMVSFATPGGSVGPHWDQYDVFLLQGQGRRRWMIDDRAAPALEYRADQELKLLRDFKPNRDWVLEPGDMLYLPPGVPHHGVAIDEGLSYSIGMRAPSEEEILIDYIESIAQSLSEDQRYQDQDLAPTHPGQISPQSVAQLRAIMEKHLRLSAAEFELWAGSFLTRYRSAHQVAPSETLAAEQELTRVVNGQANLYRNPWSKFAYLESAQAVQLFVSGDPYKSSLEAAQLLCAHKQLDGELATRFLQSAENRDLVLKLCRAGHLVVGHD